MNEERVPQTPPQGEPAGEPTPPQTKTAEELLAEKEAELEAVRQKAKEHEAQKEHWRSKYERDITNVRLPETPAPSEDDFSDEGKMIVSKFVEPLQQTVRTLQDQLVMKDVLAVHPELKDFTKEFEEYRKDYPRHKLENVAKLFLTEKGLIGEPRKGLEKPTGGPKEPISTGMSVEDVKTLRETNFRKYQELLQKGQLKIQ